MLLMYQYGLIGLAIVFLLIVSIILSGTIGLSLSRPAPSAEKYARICIRKRLTDVVIKDSWLDSDSWAREAFIRALHRSPEVASLQEEDAWKPGRDGKTSLAGIIGKRYTITYHTSWNQRPPY